MNPELPRARQRVVALDALRGFALCGILLVNLPWQIITVDMPYGPPAGGMYPIAEVLEYTVSGRFFPIFSFLFGVSFALFLDSAAIRARHPRVVLLRRLLVLGVLGAVHQLVHHGEALLPYAIVGLLVLMPASWLPRWALGPAAGLAIAGGVVLGGGIVLIPGMFLLGLAAVRYGGIDTLDARRRRLMVLFVVAAVAIVPASVWQHQSPDGEGAAVAGLVGAVLYSTALLLLLGSRAGVLPGRILAPLGRMALTNYVGATLIVIATAPLLGLHHSSAYGRMLALAAVILAAQAWFSGYWLARHRYGPLEGVWRRLTWWSRQETPRSAAGTLSS
ncbi:DUF418 domain-containing protein [Winogradskya humida]|uniref:DUF418 domain-containing protein n=1 Tax=Winogradskya humida TaxID=113566 RepID=A0ABQ3ZI25_9ACTN|nr:DUF418 domain-containing protein [Actinoplanes humidus]GIE18179.1 hypothetical protein Ahu01nite_012810 [Actinoplanes humidus]